MKLLYTVENWIKEHWIILLIILIMVLILFSIIAFLIKKINNYKYEKKIKKIWKDKSLSKTNMINIFMSELNIKFWQIEIKKINNNKKIAWFTLIGILTRVIANKYDEKYGNPKEALRSLYTFYKELREELKKYPLTFKSNIVILAFMNNELRPFLTKWNFLINEKYRDWNSEEKKYENWDQNKYIADFIKDFNLMYKSIIENKYIENLLFILGWHISTKNIAITNGVENIKNNNNYNKILDIKKEPINILNNSTDEIKDEKTI